MIQWHATVAMARNVDYLAYIYNCLELLRHLLVWTTVRMVAFWLFNNVGKVVVTVNMAPR